MGRINQDTPSSPSPAAGRRRKAPIARRHSPASYTLRNWTNTDSTPSPAAQTSQPELRFRLPVTFFGAEANYGDSEPHPNNNSKESAQDLQSNGREERLQATQLPTAAEMARTIREESISYEEEARARQDEDCFSLDGLFPGPNDDLINSSGPLESVSRTTDVPRAI
jgi:hypothetical protein